MEGHAPRIIAIDLDDTLLRADLSVSPGNRSALREASAAGARIVLASGRNIHSMAGYARELGAAGEGDYLICSNGAEIVEASTGRSVYRNLIDPESCREAVPLVEGFGLAWQVYEDGKIFVSEENEWTSLDSRLTGQPAVLIKDKEPFFERGQLKFVCPGTETAVAEAYSALSTRFAGRLSVLTSKPYFLEIMDIGSDKGRALERLAGILGVPREEVMAIGDAPNDLGMVAWAGMGCAVANAVPAVKAVAKAVSVPDNEGDAVAWLVRRALSGLI